MTLAIRDTGIGISPEDLPRVFEKGFTGYNGRRDKKSTGIGLYLCKSVLDRLGHKIRIQSEVGRGTKVLSLSGTGGTSPGIGTVQFCKIRRENVIQIDGSTFSLFL